MKKFCTFKSLTKMVKGLFAVMMITFMAFGNVFAQSYQYKLVTENQTDWSGTYLLASAVTGTSSTTYYALSGFSTTATVYGLGTDISNVVIGDSIISNSTTDAYQVTITKTLNNTYTITRNGEFLGWNSGNSLAHSASASSNKYEWNLSVNDGVLSIANANTSGRKLQWNANSPRFACYTSSQTPCRLYKKVVLDPNAIATPIFTPVAGLYYNTQTVAIATATTGATIYYTTDGTTPDETSAVYAEPITVSVNTTIKAIAIKNDNESFVAEANYSFPEAFTSVSNLKANAVNNEVYRLNAALRVIYQNGQNLFVQDNTGALLVYGNAGKTYNPGDYIYGGIYGKYTIYNGLKEFAVVADAPAMADGEAGSAIAPVVVTVADLLANYDQYESKLVTVQNVTFTGGRNFTQNGSSMVYYNGFNISNLPASIDAGRIGNVTGLVNRYNSTIQLYPRSNEDLQLAAELPLTVDFDENPAEGWVINNGTATNKWYIGQAQGFDNNKLYVSSTNGATNKYANSTSTVTSSRYVNIPAAGAVLHFDCRVNGENGCDYVRVKLDNEILGTYSSINEWATQTIDIAPAMAGAHTLAFEWHNDGSVSNQFAAAIDNINIVPVTCTQPTNLAVAVNGTSATISWDASADQSAWIVEYKLANHSEWYSVPAATTSVTLNNLQGNSDYDVRVKTNCGDESSLYVNGAFSIECQEEVIGTVSGDVTIGTGTTSNSYLPFYGLYNYTYSQQIFDAAEINASNGMVYSISFYCLTAPRSGTTGGIRIWLGNTTKSTFNSNTDYINPSELTQVYYNASNYNYTTGWNTFVFDQPFAYDGTKNLVVAYYEGNGSYNSGAFQVHSTSGNKSISHYNDNSSNVSYSSPATASGSKYFNPYRNNIKLNMDITSIVCNDVESCPAVTNVAVSNVTPNSAEVAWNASATQDNFIVEYRTSEETVWNTVNVSNANTAVLTGLSQLSNYTVRVKANCGTYDLSEPVAAMFSTPGICAPVTDITFANNANTTTLTWTAGGSENAWAVQFRPQGTDAWTTIYANVTPATVLGGLDANTDYEVRVQALCDPDDVENQSAWVYGSFTSGCSAFQLPFTESFSSSYLPDCWITDGFTFNGSTARTNSIDNWLITAPIMVPAGAVNYHITFDVTASGNYAVMVSESGTALANFTTIYNGNSNDNKVIVSIPESYKGKMVYFMLYNNVDNWLTIDNFEIIECPFIPSNVRATAVTGTSITLAWNSNEYVSNWNVEYKTGSDEWTSVPASTNPFVLTGLVGSTNYQIRVQSACSQNASSEYSETISVATACPSETLPFVEDFETSSFGICWNQVYVSGSMGWSISAGAGSSSGSAARGSKNAYFAGNNSSGSTTKLVTPIIDLSTVTTAQISFSHVHADWGGDQNELKVYIREDESSSWTLLASYRNSLSSWARETIILSSHSANAQFAFEGISNYGYPIGVDYIVVEAAPSCFTPTSISVSNVTGNSADVAWTDNNNGSYVVAYRPQGQAGWNTVSVTSGHSTTLTGLSSTTGYEVKVKAVCSATDESAYTDAVAFVTPCDGGTTFVIDNGSSYSFLPFYGYYGYGYSQQIYDASEINAPAGGQITEISFYCTTAPDAAKTGNIRIWMGNTSKSTFSSTTDFLSPSELTQVVYLPGSYSFTTGWNTITLDEPFDYDGSSNLMIAYYEGMQGYASSSFKAHSTSRSKSLLEYNDNQGSVSYTSPSTASGTKKKENYRNDIKLSICSAPAGGCAKPTRVIVTGTTTTTADISWVPGGAEPKWNVEYGVTGFVQGTGTVVTVDANNVTINGLNPATVYDVYVQAICGPNDLSDWSTVAKLITDCDVVTTFPFVEDFEGSFLPTCWTSEYVSGPGSTNWSSSSSYTHSGSKAAFIQDQSATTIHNLVTPQLAITQANAYELSFWMYRFSNYNTKYQEGVRVFANTTPNIEGATELIYVHRNYTLEPAESSDGWHQYKVTIPTSGNLYIIFQGINEYGGASYIDDISVVKFPTNDLAVTSISRPTDACEINEVMTIGLKNFGLNDVTTFNACYTVDGVNVTRERVMLEEPLAYMSATEYSFQTNPVFTLGENHVNAWVELAGDENTSNDHITSATIVVLAPTNVPYFEDFNDASAANSWSVFDANNDGVTMSISNAIDYTFNDAAAADDWMFSPCISLPVGTYKVTFDYKANSQLTETFSLYYGAAPNAINMTNLIVTENFNNTGVQTASAIFTVAQEGVYNLGVHAESGAGNLGFSVDNINLAALVVVNVTAGEHGTVTPNGAVAVDRGSDFRLTIVPDNNYCIKDLFVDGNQLAYDAIQDMNYYVYTLENVTTTHDINVTFGHKVTTSVRNYVATNLGSTELRGTIAPAFQAVVEGDEATVYGTVQEHFHLYNLLVNGVDRINEATFDGSSYTYTVNPVNVNCIIQAVVKLDTFAINYDIIGGNGTIDGFNVEAGHHYSSSVNYGEDFTSTFAAAPGYHIVSIIVDGVNYGPIDSWLFNYVTVAHNVTVVYAVDEITINTTAYGQGSVSASESFTYDPAHTYVFTATPAQGYHIAAILHNDENVMVEDPMVTFTDTLTNIVANHNYVVLFDRNFYNITATAGANGTVAPAGVTAYNFNTNAQYAIQAAIGYYISSVVIDGDTTNYTQADHMNSFVHIFPNLDADHSIAATFAQYQYTITVNAGNNGAITPATATYAFGATPAFTITPNAGYGIVDVTVDNVSVGAVANYTFTALTADHVIAATFAQYEYTITATAGANGSITPAGVTNMVHGGNQTYTITPATGYHVQDVFVDGASVGAVTSYGFTGVTANHTIYAMFEANEYTVTVNQPAHGTITPGTMTVAYGATPTFVVTPDMGYNVATITLNGSNVISAATHVNDVYTYTLPAVTANATVSATMSAKTYSITATAGAHGTIAPAGVSTVNFGENKAYTITPANGYVIDQVVVDGINMGAIGSYTFVNVVANHTINATFTYADCEMPTNMHVINIDTTSATLTWYHPNAASFDIQYKALNEATYTTISAVTGSSYELTNLQPNTSYVWHIQANCVAGNHSDMTNGQIFTTMILPVAPTIDTTGVENYVQNLVQVYSYDNNIHVVNNNNVNISNIQVYNIYGQLLYNGRVSSTHEVISMNVATGTYMVRVTTDKGIGNYKLYLR